jgi:ADP-heptose:LPS heptosyltransferase
LVARQFPQAERVLLTNFPIHSTAPASAAVLGDSGLIHRYMRYTVGTRRVGELLRLRREIRRFGPEVVVYLMPLRRWTDVLRDRIFFHLAGVRRVVGFPVERKLERRMNAATGLYESEAERLARAVAMLGDACVNDLANWDLRLTEAEQRAAASALSAIGGRPLIVCGPATKMQSKDWGRENWRKLLTRLSQRYSAYGLALIGASEDAEMSEFAAADWTGAKVNLCGRLTPRETAAVLEGAKIFIGPDSGPMHLAASVGVVCAIVFSARGLPGVWSPIGQHHQIVYHRTECFGCGLETCIEMEKKCIRSVTVEEMEQAVERALEAAGQESSHLHSHKESMRSL